MDFGTALYTLFITPLQLLFEIIYSVVYQYVGDAGLTIIALSLAINVLVLPLYSRADAIQEEERQLEAKIEKGVAHIKKTFRGDERTMMLQTYYRQNHYSPTYVLRSATSLLLQIPFFIAAYNFLSGLELLKGASFGPITDLAKPDGLLVIGGMAFNFLPILMTVINFVSTSIFTKGQSFKSKFQLYAMAVFFLFFLYTSPAGLVFYWTLNNVFSLVKTVFYKLKNPRFVLAVLSAVCSFGVIGFAGKLYINGFRRVSIAVAFLGVCLWIPFGINQLKKHGKMNVHLPEGKANRNMFLIGGMFLAVLTGLLIPSAVIKASPQEFMDFSYFVHPLWYLVSSFLVAVGMYVLWLGVFYWLADEKAKHLFESVVWGLCGAAVVNYLFFGTNLGLLNANLQFEEEFVYSLKQIGLNALVVLTVFGLMMWAYIKWTKPVSQGISIALVAVMCMSAINCVGINQSVSKAYGDGSQAEQDEPYFSLSKNGKNVVVIMLDRGIGEYIPYIFNEKPELKAQFDGFTYYSNVVSFGGFTNFGSPALYGGYEYTPIELNKRNQESLESKHNEALKVMPVLFDLDGYDVTVMDPTYAGYQWKPDLSIYDDYPNIQKYISTGYFSGMSNKKMQVSNRMRNFFLYGVMKSAPLIAQRAIYDSGNYNYNHNQLDEWPSQVIESMHKANGIFYAFMNAYTVLTNLSHMTHISEGSKGCFLMMSNDTTHEPMLLSEPGYVPSEGVDNDEYDQEHCSRFIVDGRELKMQTAEQMKHYHSNMAAMIQLGAWFDYLRDNDVYNNTRIIVVSDHGQPLKQLDELVLDDGTDSLLDMEHFYPLLLVKDFNSTGVSTSDEFMTNADVATLATGGLFENPRNPMTGKTIDNSEKNAHEQYIIASRKWDVQENNGNTFLPARWYTIHDSIWKKENWKIVAENAVMP